MALSLDPVLYGSLVGVSLGLTGGGGSTLAIPLLVYGLGLPLNDALVVSLLVVAIIALFGALRKTLNGNVDWKSAILFSITGMVISPFVVAYAQNVNENLRMVLFALLMLFVAFRMATNGKNHTPENVAPPTAGLKHSIAIGLAGALAGVISGFFGVGGGFIIVPLLTLLFAMPYKKAVGTSLAAIALISMAAVSGAFTRTFALDRQLLGLFTIGGLIGMMVGSFLIKKIPEKFAKYMFAIIIAGMAVFLLTDKLLHI